MNLFSCISMAYNVTSCIIEIAKNTQTCPLCPVCPVCPVCRICSAITKTKNTWGQQLAGLATQLRVAAWQGKAPKFWLSQEFLGPNSMQWVIGMPLRLVLRCPYGLSFPILLLLYSSLFRLKFAIPTLEGNILSINGFHDVNQKLILFLKTDPKLL